MRFPAPDVGVARFPGPDIRAVRFPEIDSAPVAFPPAPQTVVRVDTETVVDVISTGAVIGVPWHVTETIVDVISTATVSVTTAVETESVVDVVSETIQVVDVVSSVTIVDIISGTTVKPSPTINTNTAIDIASTSSVTPSPTISTNTIVDVTSAAVVIPSPTTAGETVVDIASSATVTPSPTISTNTIVDVTSTGTITNFSQVGMTKNGDQQLPSSSTWTLINTWAGDAGSTVTSNALQVKGSGTATIEVGSAWTVLGTANKDWRVLKNGVVVWTKGATTGQTFTHSFSLTVADGDLLTCEGWNNSGVIANRTIASGSGTYLRVVPV